ncbi:MAG: hypothetical protein WCV73_00135 [Patescibacteria group bacterium]|jgi:hypothetical protein
MINPQTKLSGLLNVVKKHWLAILIALLLGVLAYLPHYIFVNQSGSDFKGVFKSLIDDDLYYLMRGQDVIDGHATLANPCWLEHKNGPPMQFWLPDYLLAKPLAILGIEINQGYQFYAFLLAIISFLLVYWIIWRLGQSKKLALAGTLLLLGVLFFRMLTRVPSPAFNFIFWLSLFALLLNYLETSKKSWLIWSVINLGLLFYIYPYYWTYYVIFLVVFMFFGKLLLFDFKIKNYLLVLSGALIIGSGYFWEMWQSAQLDFYADSMTRLGMLATHFPSGFKIVILGLLILSVIIFFVKKKIVPLNSLSVFLGSAVVACIIAVNQHVITGKNLEFSSHYWPLSAVVFVFTCAYLAKFILDKISKTIWVTTIKIILLLVLAVWSISRIVIVVKSTSKPEAIDIYRQNYSSVFNWLKQNAPKETVVYANTDLSVFIPIYTSNNVFYNQTCSLFFVSDAEVQERFAINQYFNPISENDLLKFERSIWGTRYINYWAHEQSKNKLRKIFLIPAHDYPRIPETEIVRIGSLINEVKKSDFRDVLKKYQVDYLIWDKNKDPHWQLDRYDFLKTVYSSENFEIFQFSSIKN